MTSKQVTLLAGNVTPSGRPSTHSREVIIFSIIYFFSFFPFPFRIAFGSRQTNVRAYYYTVWSTSDHFYLRVSVFDSLTIMLYAS